MVTCSSWWRGGGACWRRMRAGTSNSSSSPSIIATKWCLSAPAADADVRVPFAGCAYECGVIYALGLAAHGLAAHPVIKSERCMMCQGVANRDIKLENTLLEGTTRPIIKICDFGYSKVCLRHSCQNAMPLAYTASSNTGEGMILVHAA